MAKELKGWEDLTKNGSKDSMSSNFSAKTSTSIPSSENTNVKTKDNAILESSKESTTETILSANISAKTVSIEKRLKYLDKKEHRSYYIDKEIIKKINSVNKKYNIDKSDIVNEALKLLFETLKL